MDLGFKDKSVLVTGASGGIGRSIAAAFAAEGARVAVHYRSNQQSADSILQQIGPSSACVVGADLTDQGQVKAAFARAIDRFGRLDVLIANAGVWPVNYRGIHEMTMEQWQQTLATNLTSVFLCCREFLRSVKESGIEDPSIVLIGSTAAVFGEAGHGDYSASKSGLTYGLMLTLKNEIVHIARRGRVNTVCPGWTVTPMAKKFTDDGSSIKKALSTIALRKVASPEDIANAALFLASSKAAGHISGQVLTVSGGMEGRKLYEDSDLDVTAALPRPQ